MLIQEAVEYANFIDSIRSEDTKQKYGYLLKKYAEYLQQQGRDLLKGQTTQTIEKSIIDYTLYLRKKGYASSTINSTQAAIIESQLIAYFHDNKDIKQTWKNLIEDLGFFYGDLQNIVNNTIAGKASDDSVWHKKREKILAEKENLIVIILTSHIKGL